MTNRERELAALGLHYAEGLERYEIIVLPWSGREIRRGKTKRWAVQPWNDNCWLEFDDVTEAVKASKRPEATNDPS